jgi:hypothetical protein
MTGFTSGWVTELTDERLYEGLNEQVNALVG